MNIHKLRQLNIVFVEKVTQFQHFLFYFGIFSQRNKFLSLSITNHNIYFTVLFYAKQLIYLFAVSKSSVQFFQNCGLTFRSTGGYKKPLGKQMILMGGPIRNTSKIGNSRYLFWKILKKKVYPFHHFVKIFSKIDLLLYL